MSAYTLLLVGLLIATNLAGILFGLWIITKRHKDQSQQTHVQIQTLLQANNQQSQNQQLSALSILQESLTSNFADVRQQMQQSLQQYRDSVNQQLTSLTEQTKDNLFKISQTVDKRLNEGFEKTHATFADVVKRLALIDAAQQKISDLSKDVISLQSILNDKRSRGAFGEVQLSALIKNMMPDNHFQFQYTLSNKKRADCMLFLPEPTGAIAIDAKFPLENYQLMTDTQGNDLSRKQFEQQFRQDIRKHIEDISQRYIIPGETADGAIMFIPAEAIFAEIHARFPDLVSTAQRAQVWLVSPTTLMAIITTARAVLKDAATRKQVHIIQEHLKFLAKDFQRFQGRMDNLAKHIQQAQSDVEQVHTSATKISSRFDKIEQVDLDFLSAEHTNKALAEDTLLNKT